MAWDVRRGIAIEPFVGTGGPLSRGIFYVLGVKQPLTTRQIGKKVINIPYFKDTSYSTVNRKVRDLEKKGYLKKTQTNQRVGGITNYYELTPNANLAKFLDANSVKEIFENKSQEVALTILADLIQAQQEIIEE